MKLPGHRYFSQGNFPQWLKLKERGIGQPVMETVRPLIIHIYRSAPDRTLLPRYLIEKLIMVSAMRAILNLVMSFEKREGEN